MKTNNIANLIINEEEKNEIETSISNYKDDEFLESIGKQILGLTSRDIRVIKTIRTEINEKWNEEYRKKGEPKKTFITAKDLVADFFDRSHIADKISDRWSNSPETFYDFDSWYNY